MGQKVNPNGFRYGITRKHNATWFRSKKQFANYLLEDQKIRAYFEKKVREWQIGNVKIARNQKNYVTIQLFSASPGKILGKDGSNIKKIIVDLQKVVKNKNLKIAVDVNGIEKPELNARLVAEDIATRLENRNPFRSAQKFAIRNAFRAGAKGVKTSVSGRLNGVDMARTEGYTEGEMKLHTLRQNIDYAKAIASTTYGIIGVKVWISRGEIIGKDK